MIQIIPFTNLPLTWSTDNVTLKIKPQNTYLFILSLSPQARQTTFSTEGKIQIVFKASPNYTWNHTLNSCLLSVLSLKHHIMCVGEPVLCKIGKHYIILDSIGWTENSLLSHLLLKEVCGPKGKKRKQGGSTEKILTWAYFQDMEFGTSKGIIHFLKG